MIEEKREYARANKRVTFLFYLSREKMNIQGIVSRNISAGGLFLIHSEEVSPGLGMNIDIDLHDGTPPEVVPARVMRCDKYQEGIYGLGIEFIEISPRLRRALEDYVERYKDKEPISEIERYLLDNYIEELRRISEGEGLTRQG